jgi:hypothetical protein
VGGAAIIRRRDHTARVHYKGVAASFPGVEPEERHPIDRTPPIVALGSAIAPEMARGLGRGTMRKVISIGTAAGALALAMPAVGWCFEPALTAPAMAWPTMAGAIVVLIALQGLVVLRRRGGDVALAVLLGLAMLSGAVAVASAPVSGGGQWRSARQPTGGQTFQRWIVDASRDGDTITGDVRIEGSPVLTRAALEAEIDGDLVTGVLRAGGQVVVHLEGTLDGTAVSGTYSTVQGDSGEFRWDPS